MVIPPRPNFSSESDEYFVHAFRRVVEFQHSKVSMGNWRLNHVKNDLGAILTDWERRGFGRSIDERSSLGGRQIEFHFNETGIARGKRMSAALERRPTFSAVQNRVVKLLNFVAPWLSAGAALAAAYFSYQGLQSH
ncbi:MAG: hypothetical protein ABIT09_11065 [Croceibacterium sp.]